MKLAVLVLLAACQAGGGGDDFPTGPGGGGISGGGGGGGSGLTDGGTGDGGDDGGVDVAGHVCLVTDLRRVGDPTACATTGVPALTVKLGTRSAVTDASGHFTINAPFGAGFTWRVTGTNLITSLMAFGPDHTIPAIGDVAYLATLNQSSAIVNAQEGSIVVRVVTNGAPVTQVTAISTPATVRLALYDGNNATNWTENKSGTGAKGIAWFAGVPLAVTPPTQASISLTLPGGIVVPATAVVEDQAITFVTQDLK
jgi:hypothetical protein